MKYLERMSVHALHVFITFISHSFFFFWVITECIKDPEITVQVLSEKLKYKWGIV